jgi:hypothetical protein
VQGRAGRKGHPTSSLSRDRPKTHQFFPRWAVPVKCMGPWLETQGTRGRGGGGVRIWRRGGENPKVDGRATCIRS